MASWAQSICLRCGSKSARPGSDPMNVLEWQGQ